jgi:hypothetical protein
MILGKSMDTMKRRCSRRWIRICTSRPVKESYGRAEKCDEPRPVLFRSDLLGLPDRILNYCLRFLRISNHLVAVSDDVQLFRSSQHTARI